MDSSLINLAAQRRASMDAIVIPNAQFEEAFATFDFLIEHGKQKGKGSTLAAPMFACSQSGKTTLLTSYQAMKNLGVPDGGKAVPVLIVTLEANTTRKGLAINILEALEECGFTTGPYTGTELVLLRRVRELLRLAGVQLLVIDEVHHLVNKDKDTVAYAVGETIKRMLIKRVCPIVLSGIIDGQSILTNEQLLQRCVPAIKLAKLSTDTKHETEEFLMFLGSYLSEVQKQKIAMNATDFIAGDAPLCILEVTDGVLGAACNLIKEAVRVMTFHGRDKLERADFAAAANGLFVQTNMHEGNPFLDGLAALVTTE